MVPSPCFSQPSDEKPKAFLKRDEKTEKYEVWTMMPGKILANLILRLVITHQITTLKKKLALPASVEANISERQGNLEAVAVTEKLKFFSA